MTIVSMSAVILDRAASTYGKCFETALIEDRGTGFGTWVVSESGSSNAAKKHV